MPWDDDGAERLAAELEDAHEVLDPPRLVWLFDPEHLREYRAALYGWRHEPLRQALVVWREARADRVGWVCEPYVRPRHE